MKNVSEVDNQTLILAIVAEKALRGGQADCRPECFLSEQLSQEMPHAEQNQTPIVGSSITRSTTARAIEQDTSPGRIFARRPLGSTPQGGHL